MAKTLTLKPGRIPLDALRTIHAGDVAVAIDPAWRDRVEAARRTVERVVDEDAAVYGVNTGFGKLAATRIAPDQVEELQRRLVLSHAAGVGPDLPAGVVRLVIALKAASLARGYSGVRPALVEALTALLEADVLPAVPAKGSVGASGDLAPLAHLAAALTGVGEVRVEGERVAAEEGLAAAGLAPLTLAAKEGLALVNGTQVSTALALAGLFAIEDVFKAAVVAGALSVDAAAGADTPFDARIHAIRGQPGQIAVAEVYAALLEGSDIRASHVDCGRVQDPYSLRCQPQVMGAILDQMRHAADVLTREANGVSDNPLVFPADGDILSGGNFHAEPVALVADLLALALAEIGSLSERRIALLTDASLSSLPPFLVAEPGINSGFMEMQVVAAALVAENRQRAAPASIDNIPTSANQEDHVSMATHGAARLLDMAENAASVIAIEWMAAAQGIDLRRPLRSSPALERAVTALRTRVAFFDKDRFAKPEIDAATGLVREGALGALVPGALVPSETGGAAPTS